MSQESYSSYRLSEAELKRIEEDRRKLEEANRRAEEERIKQQEALRRLSWAQDVEGLRNRVGPADSTSAPRNAVALPAKSGLEKLHDEVVHLGGLLERARREGTGGALSDAIAAAQTSLSSAQAPGSFVELQLLTLRECGMRVEAALVKRRRDRARL